MSETETEELEVDSLHDTAKVSICGGAGSSYNLAINFSESTMLFLGNPERVTVAGNALGGITVRASQSGVLLNKSGRSDARRRLVLPADDIRCIRAKVSQHTIDVVLYPAQARAVVSGLPDIFLGSMSPWDNGKRGAIEREEIGELRRRLSKMESENARLQQLVDVTAMPAASTNDSPVLSALREYEDALQRARGAREKLAEFGINTIRLDQEEIQRVAAESVGRVMEARASGVSDKCGLSHRQLDWLGYKACEIGGLSPHKVTNESGLNQQDWLWMRNRLQGDLERVATGENPGGALPE